MDLRDVFEYLHEASEFLETEESTDPEGEPPDEPKDEPEGIGPDPDPEQEGLAAVEPSYWEAKDVYPIWNGSRSTLVPVSDDSETKRKREAEAFDEMIRRLIASESIRLGHESPDIAQNDLEGKSPQAPPPDPS